MKSRTIIFVIGGPGAGKSTHCANIARKFQYTHISVRNILIAERKKPSSVYSPMIDFCMRYGRDVPAYITVQIILQAIRKAPSSRFVIDDYPRNEDDVQIWHRELGIAEDFTRLLFVFYLSCPEIICVHRCLRRTRRGRKPPDHSEITAIKKRFSAFREDSMAVIDFYKTVHLLKKIDASQPKEEVFGDIRSIFHRF
ncbi:unnamed protein product [Nezara viridula]|uniref:Uncharacterized protein n=1 Tax=Nezara viridula TaxID=85310 RepID=A0A9P0H112_NEZVI|nr:unnamed protein product [Nezara viridula]CAH1393374.1 unnamed protein product [Nezara viridula]CAH1393375.1 unnamed protein product [Nezara viridula]CAH1393376.1 unnamed protein product [Nezara viridula]